MEQENYYRYMLQLVMFKISHFIQGRSIL